MANPVEQIKAWLTPALLTILGGFIIDLKNDVKVLLDRTARLEVRVEYEKELREQKTAHLINFKGMELVYDRHKKLHFISQSKYFDYV